MYKLHCFSQSGNSYKVALLLEALGQPWEPVFVDYMNGAQTRQAGWREEVNAMGEAPVLEADGRRLAQSGAILTWLAERHGAFGGRDADERHEVLRWILFDNHKFTSYFATYRFMKAFGAAEPEPAVMAFLRSRMDAAYQVAERHLATNAWVVGGAPTIADFSMAGYVFYPVEESGLDIAALYPNIGAWMQRLRALPGWGPPYALLPGERIMPKR
jgi:glutathione S-transferase